MSMFTHLPVSQILYARAQRMILHESSEKKRYVWHISKQETCQPSHSSSIMISHCYLPKKIHSSFSNSTAFIWGNTQNIPDKFFTMSAPWSEWCGCVVKPLVSLHHKWRHPSIPQSHPPAIENHRKKRINHAKVQKIPNFSSQSFKKLSFPPPPPRGKNEIHWWNLSNNLEVPPKKREYICYHIYSYFEVKETNTCRGKNRAKWRQYVLNLRSKGALACFKHNVPLGEHHNIGILSYAAKQLLSWRHFYLGLKWHPSNTTKKIHK